MGRVNVRDKTYFFIGVLSGALLTFITYYPNTMDFVSASLTKGYGPWSIGIFTGSSAFELSSPSNFKNPVLTGRDVTDIDATFVADPFLIRENDQFHLFFEVLNRKTGHGDIGHATSQDGLDWSYRQIVLDEDFHLSYPYVFKWNDGYYLIPESHEDFSVRLYKALSFPTKWDYVGNILEGHHFVDPSIFRHDNQWWLFVTSPKSDHLNVYFSNQLEKGWQPHPMNPLVKLDKNISRPGGRVVHYDNRLYRFTQDDEPTYGNQVFAFEILELTTESYKDTIVSDLPIVTMSHSGWNAKGMHHVDPLFHNGHWMAAVDGKTDLTTH